MIQELKDQYQEHIQDMETKIKELNEEILMLKELISLLTYSKNKEYDC